MIAGHIDGFTWGEGWMLHVWDSKTEYRECPVSVGTKKKAKMIKNRGDIPQNQSLIDSSKRTVQRWISEHAAQTLVMVKRTGQRLQHTI
jgi:hypothetical protein